MGKDIDEIGVLPNFANGSGDRYDVMYLAKLLGDDVLWAVGAFELYEFIVGLVFHLAVFSCEFRVIGARRSKLRAYSGAGIFLH